jgi:transcriptional regulator GlxA family with amidase domain
MKPITVAILGFDGVAGLDLIGPLEAFAVAEAEGKKCYSTRIVGLTSRPFAAESGVVFRPHASLAEKIDIDTLVVPGGPGLRKRAINMRVVSWLLKRAPQIRRIASVCTGIYGLAPTNLLDGRHVATHWRFARDVGQRFPKVKMDANALFRKDGKFYTSAGVTAGIDLALALIEEDFGTRVALTVARELVVFLKRPGGQAQYSEPLQFQVEAADAFGELVTWICGHLQQDLTVDALAKRACLCPRHFSRRFKKTFRRTPSAFVEDLRLNEARQRLSVNRALTIDSISASVGFRSADAFRRAFHRRFGVNPTHYRHRFQVRDGPTLRQVRLPLHQTALVRDFRS